MSDPDETAKRLLRAAQQDQTEAAITTLGTVTGVLFANLRKQMPVTLAATLTRDWFYLNTCRSLWPEQMPSPPFWDTRAPEEGGE